MHDNQYYNKKTTFYKSKKKSVFYDIPIFCCRHDGEPKQRRNYNQLSEKEKLLSDDRRMKYYQNKIYELIEIGKLNDLNYMLTLTFAENITDNKEAYKRLKLFFDRLKYYLYKQRKDTLKYICCMEYQKRGAIHYHLVCNCGYIPFDTLVKLWGNGYVYIKEINNDAAFVYVLKYCVKNVMKLSSEKRIRFIHTSNNLIKPMVVKEWTNDTIDDAIIDNLEDIICDGRYQIRNYAGNIINNASYIECRK